MMNKKFLSLLLIVVLAFSIAGCGTSNDADTKGDSSTEAGQETTSGSQDTEVKEIKFPLDESITMTMFAVNGGVELPDNNAFKKMEEMTNIKWEVDSALPAALQERRNLLIASNTYPEVFYKAGFTNEEVIRYGSQGVLMPLEDLIDQYAPNLKQRIEERPIILDYITAPDGHIYTLPQITDPGVRPLSLYINGKWMETLNISEPRNIDEFYQMLKEFKEKDPNGSGVADEIPFTIAEGWQWYMMPYFGVPLDYESLFYEKDNELFYGPTDDAYKELIVFLAKLYSEGLLDEVSLIQTGAEQNSKGQGGDVYGAFFNIAAFQATGRGPDLDHIVLTPFEKGSIAYTPAIAVGTFSITDKCENPEEAMKWVDYFYSEEGGTLVWLGTEGVTYEFNEDGNWIWITPEGADVGEHRFTNRLQGSAQVPSYRPEIFQAKSDDVHSNWMHEGRARIEPYAAEPFPVIRFSADEQRELSTITADIIPYINEFTAQCVMGSKDVEEEWGTYLETLNAMGLSRLIEIYETAYENK